MKVAAGLLGAAVALGIGAGIGYWWHGRTSAGTSPDVASAVAAPSTITGGATQPKVLYYRNPMGLPDTSPVPKKDPMGMDYIAVYEGEATDPGNSQVIISIDKVQKLGVRSEPAAMRSLDKVVKAVGRIEVDERRVYAIAPKFEGWVERLHVNATGQPVGKGQPLFEAYSPELVSAQREYAIANEAVKALKDAGAEPQASMQRLADASLARLRNWDISDEQVRALSQSGEARRTLTFRSPVSGIVMEKKAVQGMRFMPGESLYQIADLSSLWVVADVYEQDIGLVRAGARAKVTIAAYPGRGFEGTITYVYPTLKPETRTVPVRLELANPRQLLKPAMFAEVELPVGGNGKVVTIPRSAVIDSGARQIVLVQRAEGRFEPRDVKLGERTENYVEVLEGVKEGESVVVSANFLLDAESNLRAAIGGFGHAGHGAAPAAPAMSKPAAAGGAIDATTPSPVGHRGAGTIESIDRNAGTVSIAHAPIPTLKWPAMTMEFEAANGALLAGLAPGRAVSFEFVERSPGAWVITKMTPRSAAPGAASAPVARTQARPPSPPAGHSGH